MSGSSASSRTSASERCRHRRGACAAAAALAAWTLPAIAILAAWAHGRPPGGTAPPPGGAAVAGTLQSAGLGAGIGLALAAAALWASHRRGPAAAAWLAPLALALLAMPPVATLVWLQAHTPFAALPPALQAGLVIGLHGMAVPGILLALGARALPADQRIALHQVPSLPVRVRHVVWPHMRPYAIAGFLVLFALAASDTVTAPAAGLRTAAEAYLLGLALDPSPAGSIGAAVPLLVPAGAAALALAVALSRGLDATGASGAAAPGEPPAAPVGRAAASRTVAAIACVLASGGALHLFSPDAAPVLPGAGRLLSGIATSFLGAVVATAIGYALVAGACRRGGTGAPLAGALATAFLLPAATWAACAAYVSSHMLPQALALSPLAITLAHAARLLPFVLLALLVHASMAGWRRRAAVAASLRLPAVRAWRHIDLPLDAPALLAIVAVGTALAASSVDIPLLTAPPGSDPPVVRIYNLLHYGDLDAAAALGLGYGLMAAGLALLVAAAALGMRDAHR